MKYIDAERLKEWLEKQADMEFKKTEENASSPVLCHFHNGCRMQALNTIDFIDSLQQEQPSEDLAADIEMEWNSFNKHLVKYEEGSEDVVWLNWNSFNDIALYFFNLGKLNARKEK